MLVLFPAPHQASLTIPPLFWEGRFNPRRMCKAFLPTGLGHAPLFGGMGKGKSLGGEGAAYLSSIGTYAFGVRMFR